VLLQPKQTMLHRTSSKNAFFAAAANKMLH
jgi:hypothetical protein